MYQAGIQVSFINRWKRGRRSRLERQTSSGMISAPSASQGDVQLNSRRNSKRVGRKRQGSGRNSFMSQNSQESDTPEHEFADMEEEFLHAAEFGDIHCVKKVLSENSDFNVDCIDALGRTALRLAVKNEHLEIVEILLEKSTPHHIYEAVLQAISAEHSQIAEVILKHRRYLEMWKERRKMGDTDGFYKTAYPDSQFSPDITPLILAAQKNQFEIVQILLIRGESILKPHKFSCGCQECRNKMKFDQLRLAKYRLNAYRGLASEAYISLSSKDPILTAFELAEELRRLSRVEKHFKSEYRDLADHLSDYVVKLLDRIRTQKELELVLNKTGKHHQEKFESLARFKLALNYKEKKFIAHPSCQQRVVRTWYNGVGRLERASWTKRLLMTAIFICAYPFLVFLHIFFPGSKGAKLLQFPVIKFLCHAMSFMVFLMLIVVSTIEASKSVSKSRTLKTELGQVHVNYMKFRNETNTTIYDDDFPLRVRDPEVTELLMSLWIVGMVCHECNQIYHAGFVEHLSNFYNLLDFLVLSTYVAIFTLKYWVLYKFHLSCEFLSNYNNMQDTSSTHMHIYWLNADRIYWVTMDPLNLFEGTFAIANILSFFRISYLLPANETLGPLQISLGRMIKDIAKFAALFVLVILAFMVGLHNLYWYYAERTSIEFDTPSRPKDGDVKADKSFGGFMETFRTVFWSLFGRGEPEAVSLGNFNNTFTENIGYVIYGAYNVAMVTVLLNMLIAMMSRSFTLIAEDSDREWKFARSLLYMDYIGNGGTLPAPLNIIGAPKAFLKLVFCQCCCRGRDDDDDDENEEAPANATQAYPARGTNGPVGKTRENPKSPLAKTAAIETTGSAHPSDNMSVKDVPAANDYTSISVEGTPSKSTPRRNPTPAPLETEEEKLTYQLTMQRIVQRYIFDIQREAEVTEDDFEEIKQDVSSIRYDLVDQMNSRSIIEDEIRANMATVIQSLQIFRDEFGPKRKQDGDNPDKADDRDNNTVGKFRTVVHAAHLTGFKSGSNVIEEDPISEAENGEEAEHEGK